MPILGRMAASLWGCQEERGGEMEKGRKTSFPKAENQSKGSWYLSRHTLDIV